MPFEHNLSILSSIVEDVYTREVLPSICLLCARVILQYLSTPLDTEGICDLDSLSLFS